MTTCTLAEVRAAIAADITAATGLRCSPYLKDQATPPDSMIDIEGPERITFTDQGAHAYTATLLYIDQRVSEKAAQERCDELRDPFHTRSLAQAINNGENANALTGFSYGTVLQPGLLTPVRLGA